MRLTTGIYAGLGVGIAGVAFLANRGKAMAAAAPPAPVVTPSPGGAPVGQPVAVATTVQARPLASPPGAVAVRVEQMQLNAMGYGSLVVDGNAGGAASQTHAAEQSFFTNSGTGAASAAAYAAVGDPNYLLNAIDDAWRARNGQPAAPGYLPPITTATTGWIARPSAGLSFCRRHAA